MPRGRAILPARVLRRALSLDAASILLVRRRGGADAMADPQDRAPAGQMAGAAELMRVMLLDCLVVRGKLRAWVMGRQGSGAARPSGQAPPRRGATAVRS